MKEIKAREVLYEHWAPPCQTFSPALAQHRARYKQDLYGSDCPSEAREQLVDEHTRLCQYVCKLCRAKHEVGDFFSAEHIYPSLMLDFKCWKELVGLPSVFIVVFDNCQYGEEYRHRQCLITNAPWLLPISSDCPGQPIHSHANQIGFGKMFSTKDVSAYCEGVVKKWANLFGQFLRGKDLG